MGGGDAAQRHRRVRRGGLVPRGPRLQPAADGSDGGGLRHRGHAADSTRVQGDPWSEWMCAVLEAACRLAVGEVEAAAALAADALRAFDELDDAWGRAMAQLLRGMAARAVGDIDLARVASSSTAWPRRSDVTYVGEEARLLAELAGVDADAGAPAATPTPGARRARAGASRHRRSRERSAGAHDIGRRRAPGGRPCGGRAPARRSRRRRRTRRPDRRLASGCGRARRAARRARCARAGGRVARRRRAPTSDGVRTRIAVARGRLALLSATGRPADGAALLAEATGSALGHRPSMTDAEDRRSAR